LVNHDLASQREEAQVQWLEVKHAHRLVLVLAGPLLLEAGLWGWLRLFRVYLGNGAMQSECFRLTAQSLQRVEPLVALALFGPDLVQRSEYEAS
jgi:hypothetical protein